MPTGSLAAPIILLAAAPAMGYFARMLADFNPGAARAVAKENAYPLPRSKVQLPRCVAAIQAEYPGGFEFARYQDLKGTHRFVFRVVGVPGVEARWVECDADTGELIREHAPGRESVGIHSR